MSEVFIYAGLMWIIPLMCVPLAFGLSVILRLSFGMGDGMSVLVSGIIFLPVVIGCYVLSLCLQKKHACYYH